MQFNILYFGGCVSDQLIGGGGILNEETQGDPPSPSPPGETSLRIMALWKWHRNKGKQGTLLVAIIAMIWSTLASL